MLRCSISNVAPVHPVVGAPTGLVYERSTIEKAIAESGRCPVTHVELRREDLVAIKQDQPQLNPPRSLEATSVPSLLAAFQNEWDATALELFKVRQTLDRTRKELAQALYQHDAACRVIARLTRERDEARNALASVSANGKTAAPSTSSNTAPQVEPFTAEELNGLKEHQAVYGAARSKRKSMTPPSEKLGWKPHEVIKRVNGNHIDLDDDSDAAVVGGADGIVRVYRRSTGKIDKEYSLDGVPVRKAKFVRDGTKKVIAITEDSKLRIGGGSSSEFKSISLGSQPLDCCDFANHQYALVGEEAGVWCIIRLSSGIPALTGRSETGSPITCVHAHPDGRFFATGGKDNGDVELWSLEDGRVATLSGDSKSLGPARFISFGQNGINLAVGYGNGTIRIFDLRQLESSLASFEAPSKTSLCSMSFDPTGQTLLSAFNDGTVIIRNVVKGGNWPVSFQASHSDLLVSASPGNGSCLTLSREGIVTEWR